MVRLAVNSPDTNQSTGLNSVGSIQSVGMQQQPQPVSGNNIHPPPLLSPIQQHQHMHHENGHGLYIPYTGEFYPTEQGYYMPQELCPTHAPLCLHSEFGKHQHFVRASFCFSSLVRFFFPPHIDFIKTQRQIGGNTHSSDSLQNVIIDDAIN